MPGTNRPAEWRMPLRPGRRILRHNQDGAAAIEFALLFPTFLLMLLGSLDMAQMIYANSVLRGAVEQAARSSSLETGDTSKADQKVKEIMKPILPGVLIISSRMSYYDFSDIGRPEKWEDRNLNGTCDANEAYTDENGDGAWNADVGALGNGGAGDVVIYKVTAKYTPVFHIPFDHALNLDRTLSATSVRKNQPFARQEDPGVRAGTCT